MRTTLAIDADILEDVVRTTGEKSKSRAVSRALEEYLRSTRLKKLREAPGRITLDENWSLWRRSELGRLREIGLDEQR